MWECGSIEWREGGHSTLLALGGLGEEGGQVCEYRMEGGGGEQYITSIGRTGGGGGGKCVSIEWREGGHSTLLALGGLGEEEGGASV